MAYYWCTEHNRVETDGDKCAGFKVLGPYKSSGEAAEAIKRIREREAKLDAEDEAW